MKMFGKIKQILRGRKFPHSMMSVNRWHWVHFPSYEPLSIEIEYKCPQCSNLDYVHLFDDDAKDWADAIGNYKKE